MPLLTDHVLDEDAAVRVLTRRLILDYSGRFRADEVGRVVAEVHDEFASAKVRIYIPILVGRKARERLEGDDSECSPRPKGRRGDAAVVVPRSQALNPPMPRVRDHSPP